MSIRQADGAQTPRRVIAVVTDAFAPFHRDVLEGLQPHFSAAGFGTLGVAGRDVRTDRLLEAADGRHGLYRGAFGTRLDVRGAVVVCGATHPSMSAEAIQSYVSGLTNGPVVSLGIALPNVPSVEIDWPTGIEALMAHVLAFRSNRRLAFVRGFPGDPHSKMREAGFRQAMRDADLDVDERLVVSGNYSVADARNAVAGLLANGLSFDGVVAANDDMAVGALAAIAAHGLAVPRDVFVAGFDDAICSIVSDPTLTTVRLDTPRLTAATADLVLGAIESGERLPADLIVNIDSGLIVRQSTSPDVADAKADTLERLLVDRWDRSRAPDGVDLDELAAAAVTTLRSGSTTFLDWFDQLCASAAASRVDSIWLRHTWRELHSVVAGIEDSTDLATVAIMLRHLAAIDRQLHPIETRHQTEVIVHRQLQERLVMRLATCSDTATLWEALRTGLRSLGMLNAWVVAYEAPSDDDPQHSGDSMELIFSLDADDLVGIERFEPRRILPSRVAPLLEDDMHVLVPLRAGDSDIGYMVVEPRGEYLFELEAIASGVAQVLRHVQHVADLEGQTARLHRVNEALDRLAGQDTLTGLANRKHFLARLQEHVADTGRNGSLAMLFLDLDGFKQINDTLGHGAGDQLLRIIAVRLRNVIEDTDTLARFGGDEFTIIVHDEQDAGRILDVAERTLEAVAKPSLLADREVTVSASLGIAQFPLDGTTAEELIRNADLAMYAAKEAGKNRFEMYGRIRDNAHSTSRHGRIVIDSRW